jgi:osmoprotectant transport system ATP-binding protein
MPHWTVQRNIELVPRLLGREPEWRRRRSDELLALIGLEPDVFRRRLPRELSGGQRQRVAFARALAAEPDIVLFDEPFGALDPLTRLELQGEFLRLQAALRKTMVVVTHDLREAFRLGDRVAVLRDGKLLQVGEPDTLRRSPADDYVRALLRTVEP